MKQLQQKLWQVTLEIYQMETGTNVNNGNNLERKKVLETLRNNLMKEIKGLQDKKTGIKYLPNTKHFKITHLQPKDVELILKTGISRRMGKAEYETTPHTNHHINRYIRKQLEILHTMIGNPQEFWSKVLNLIHHSEGYTTILINQMFPNWARHEKWKRITKIVRREMSAPSTYTYKIVQIPKPNSEETRPLSVPNDHNRIRHGKILHLLQIWMKPFTSETQHGFTPGRGTMTAWQKILQEVLNSSTIWEYDMKKFFDSINLTYLTRMLRSMGVEEELVMYLDSCWRTPPTEGKFATHQTWTSSLQKYRSINYHLTGKYQVPNIKELINIKHQLKENKQLGEYTYHYGIGQGSPVSPLLATIL